MYKLFWSLWAILMMLLSFLTTAAGIYSTNNDFKHSGAYGMATFCFLWSAIGAIRIRNQG